MSGLTPRFGLSFFGGSVEGSLNDDGQKYTLQDRLLIDRLFAAIENHNYAVASEVAEPTSAPTAAVSADQGGTLPAGETYFYAVSFVDAQGLETRISDEVEVSTPDILAVPSGPTADVIDTGNLLPGVYYYAITALRGEEETPISSPATVTLLPGDGGVVLAFQPLGDAERYRVWRMGASESGYTRIGFAEGTTFTDGGEVPPNPCPTDPNNQPPQFNAGIDRYSVEVSLGSVDATAVRTPGIRSWRLYRSGTSGNYGSQSLVHEVVETIDELDPTAARMTSWIDDGDLLVAGRPTLTSQRLALKPYTFPTMASLPATTDGYPENYPVAVDGDVYVKSGAQWRRLGSGGSDINLWQLGGYSANSLVVHLNALWRTSTATEEEPGQGGTAWTKLLQGGDGSGGGGGGTFDPSAGLTGLVLVSPNGGRFTLSVNDDGTLATTPEGGGTAYPFVDDFETTAAGPLGAPYVAPGLGFNISHGGEGFASHYASFDGQACGFVVDSGSPNVTVTAVMDSSGATGTYAALLANWADGAGLLFQVHGQGWIISDERTLAVLAESTVPAEGLGGVTLSEYTLSLTVADGTYTARINGTQVATGAFTQVDTATYSGAGGNITEGRFKILSWSQDPSVLGAAPPEPYVPPADINPNDPTAFYDDFGRPDEALGAPWMTTEGDPTTFAVRSGAAEHWEDTGSSYQGVVDSGSVDVDMEAFFDLSQVSAGATFTRCGFVVGASSTTGPVYVFIDEAQLLISSMVNYTSHEDYSIGHARQSFKLRLRTTGSRYELWKDDVLILDTNATPLSFGRHTGTRHGFATDAFRTRINYFWQRPSQHAPGPSA